MNKKLTQQYFADHIGVSRQAVSKMVIDGAINLSEGLDVCRLKYIDNLREVAAGRSSDGDYDLTEERARLAHHQANKTELEEQRLAGELIDRKFHEAIISDMASTIRANALAIPTKSAHQFLNLTEMEEIQAELKAVVYELLNELTSYEPSADILRI